MKLTLLLTLFVFTITPALASPENDRVYQLETVGCLKATDNMDGLFADYLDEQFTKYFGRQTRFVQKKLKGLNEILGDSSSKQTALLKEPEILKKISQKFKVESLIRTRVYKENDSYRFVMEWVYAPKGDVLSTVEFRYTDPGKDEGLQGSDLPLAIQRGIDDLIKKLPFLGQITGINGDTVTVNVGHAQGVNPRDILTIYTLQSVRRHPLLKTIEEWRWQPVARVQVEQVEDSLSFGKVIETEPNLNVIRFQKVREILAAPPEAIKGEMVGAHEKKDIPRIGWVAGNIGIGNYSRDVGVVGNTYTGRAGGGMMQAFEIDSQIWLNSRFIAQGSFMASIFKYNPTIASTGAEIGTSYNGSASQFRLAGGYSLFAMKTVYDPMAWVHAGIKSTSIALPTGTSNFTADSSTTSFFVGLGGSVPVNEDFGAMIGLDLGLLRSGDSPNLAYPTGSFGSGSSSSDMSFSLAGTYHFQEQIFLRLMIKLTSMGIDFPNGENVSQKMFSISPSVMYYF